jgi:FdhE protein
LSEHRSTEETTRIEQAMALARAEKPAYSHLYPLLEGLFLARAGAAGTLDLSVPELPDALRAARWRDGLPLLNRWDFPIDIKAAETVFLEIAKTIPREDNVLAKACSVLSSALSGSPEDRERFWHSFLHHELEPWEEWIDTREVDLSSFLFLGRSSVRPSIEWTARRLMEGRPAPEEWLRGYCPVCGSLPSLLFLEGEGERRGFCSWCAHTWELHRLQCPYCENRGHESLGYLGIEAEPRNRVQYCNLCKFYFKQIDTRELAYRPYLPLEEWATLHLDLVAQRAGWKQPPSPSPAVYGKT